MWTVRTWTRHTGESHDGRYETEAEAFRAAAEFNRKYDGCGVHAEAVLTPDDLR